MKRVPFGIERLDAMIGGGPPAGSVVLVAGEAGAGAREFCYTSAVLCGLAREDGDLFELHYGALAPEASLPSSPPGVRTSGHSRWCPVGPTAPANSWGSPPSSKTPVRSSFR